MFCRPASLVGLEVAVEDRDAVKVLHPAGNVDGELLPARPWQHLPPPPWVGGVSSMKQTC